MMKIIKSLAFHSRMMKPFKNKNQLIIFNYHRLKSQNRSMIFDDKVFGPDAERFRHEMSWIKKETQILSEDELIDIIYNKKEMKGIYSMVTFDDGYIDNFEIAFPVLKEFGIPATFFIPTWHLSERKLGWWDIVAYLIKNSNKKEFVFREKTFHLNKKRVVIDYLTSKLKNMEPTRVEDFLNDLSLALEVELPTLELQSRELMTWDHLRKMKKEKMSIGSHTHEHIILSRQSLPDLKNQLQKSIEILEREMGEKINSISYPVGEYEHFDYETKRISKELGFKIGFSYRTGINQLDSIDPFDVKRISFAPYWPNLDLALAFPKRAFPYIQTQHSGEHI